MLIKSKTVCFSGHRSKRLPKTAQDLEELKVKIYDEIDRAIADGFDTFLYGGCYGFDLMCAELVLLRRTVRKPGDPEQIRLYAAVPFEKQAEKWYAKDQELYFNILKKCDGVIRLSKGFSLSCYNKRNEYMVDHSSRLICYYDGNSGGTSSTIKYANKNRLEIINLYDFVQLTLWV